MDNLYYIILLFVFLYIFISLNYYIFKFQEDTTLYIEDSKEIINIRDDNKLTFYENPTSYKENGNIIHEKANRSFFPRIVYFIGKETEQLSLYVFFPSQNKKLCNFKQSNIDSLLEKYTNISINNLFGAFCTISDLDIIKNYKNLEFLEIPLVGNQAVYIPKGYWIYSDDVSMLREIKIYNLIY